MHAKGTEVVQIWNSPRCHTVREEMHLPKDVWSSGLLYGVVVCKLLVKKKSNVHTSDVPKPSRTQ